MKDGDGAGLGPLIGELEREIPALLPQHRVPGVAVGICDASRVIWSAGFGTVDGGTTPRISPSTMFSLQSASKMYTASAVMLAVQMGMVELDQPITGYLPEFTVRSRFEPDPQLKITLRHLLSHTAGFTHEAPEGGNYEVGRASFAAHCRSISDTWLRFPVGHHFEYSNLGVDLAGYVLERRSGLPFHEFVRRELLAPLGLRRTTFDHRVVSREKNRAIGHQSRSRRIPVRVPMVAAGAAYASVDDALRFLQFHLRSGEDRLEPELLDEMCRIPFAAHGQEAGFALGLIRTRWEPGIYTHGHGGGGFGFQCELCWVPDAGVGVVVLSNYSGHTLHVDIAQRILRNLGGRPSDPTPLPEPVSVPKKTIDRLVGTYVGGRGGALEVLRDGDNLLVGLGNRRHPARIVGSDEIVLEEGPPSAGRQLFVLKRRERFRFLPGDDGGPRYLQSLDDGYVRYRNDLLPGDLPTPLDSRWEGEYGIRVSGATRATARLRNDPEGPRIGFGDFSAPLGLHRPGIYFSPDGEALDLHRNPPTYANIKLWKARGG